MKALSETWFADGYIDFELKKYTLLAYLQEINKYFTANKLYPQLADVIFHYNNIVSFRKNKKFLQEQFPKKLSGVQMQKLQLLYEQLMEDDELMQELETIINYSAGKLKTTISSGTEIYEFVESNLSIYPVGLLPLNNQEGYFFLSEAKQHDVRVYEYRLGFFEMHQERYRTLKTEYIDTWRRSIVYTFENIKSELIRIKKDFPNPAVYSIESELSYPIEETVLPIAKRRFVKFISDEAA